MSDETKQTCETCRYWTAGDPNDPKRMTFGVGSYGDCRRYPFPHMTASGAAAQFSFRRPVWTLPSDWCGEHREK